MLIRISFTASGRFNWESNWTSRRGLNGSDSVRGSVGCRVYFGAGYCGLAGVDGVPVAGLDVVAGPVVDAEGLAARFFLVVVVGAGHFGAGGGVLAARRDASCF